MIYQQDMLESAPGSDVEPMFNLDGRLLALPLAFDHAVVTRLFEQHWPEHAGHTSSPVVVQACRRLSVSYQPGQCCLITYELMVQQPGSTSYTTIGVVEVTPGGVRHRLFWDDPQIPWVVLAIDQVRMRDRFAAIAEDSSQIHLDQIAVVRYKPGQHCILRYDLHLHDQRQCWWGKVFAHDAAPLLTTLNRLHQCTQTSPRLPHIPQPGAYWPDLHLLIQAAVVDGTSLHQCAFDPCLPDAVREHAFSAIGARLGALHIFTDLPGPQHTLSDDLRALYEYRPAIAQLAPKSLKQVEGLIALIDELAAYRCEPPFVPSHGACRTDQWMLSHDNLVLLDLDTFGWANPARDLGNLLAYLHWKALRQPVHAAFIDRACHALLDGYATIRPTPDPYWLALYQAASLLKIAGRRFRSLSLQEWPLIPTLLDAAQALLQPLLNDRAQLPAPPRLCKLPLPPALPTLGARVDVEAVRSNLEPLLMPLARAEYPPRIMKATLLAEKPGSRAVIAYSVDGIGAGQSVVIGKQYAALEQAGRVYRTMQLLWNNGPVSAAGGIPQPLGIIPQLALLIYLRGEGQPLSDAIVSPRGKAALCQTGTWLRALHQQRLPLDKHFNLTTELSNLQIWAALIGATWPTCADDACWIVGQLEARAPTLHCETDVPIHKDFHPEHVLFRDRATVIDFDEVRLGDPTFDLAHFCANLHLLAYRRALAHDRIVALQTCFLDTYAGGQAWHLDARWTFFYAYTCIKIAKQLCTRRGLHPRPTGGEQQRQVRTILAYGRAMLHTELLRLYPVPMQEVPLVGRRPA